MTGMLLMHALATLAFASDLSVETVSRLKVAWTYHMKPADAVRVATSETTPLVVDNVMYLGSPYGRIVALDATTGKPVMKDEQMYASNKQEVLEVAGKLADRVRKGLGDTTSTSQSASENYPAATTRERRRGSRW